MKNFISSGKTYDVVLAAAVLSGGLLFIGTDGIPGVAVTDGAIGETVAFKKEGVYSFPKTAGMAMAQGLLVYQDAVTLAITNTSNTGANKKVGWVFDAATAGATTVNVELLNSGQTS